MVAVGARLVVDCIYSKARGTPEWSWANTSAEYPTGWAGTWHYRLELPHVGIQVRTLYRHYGHYVVQDSGVFTCTTQRGYRNRLRVVVTNRTCPAIQLRQNVGPSTVDTHIGTEVIFSCPAGYTLHGQDSVLCRDDGRYSRVGSRYSHCVASHLVRAQPCMHSCTVQGPGDHLITPASTLSQ